MATSLTIWWKNDLFKIHIPVLKQTIFKRERKISQVKRNTKKKKKHTNKLYCTDNKTDRIADRRPRTELSCATERVGRKERGQYHREPGARLICDTQWRAREARKNRFTTWAVNQLLSWEELRNCRFSTPQWRCQLTIYNLQKRTNEGNRNDWNRSKYRRSPAWAHWSICTCMTALCSYVKSGIFYHLMIQKGKIP